MPRFVPETTLVDALRSREAVSGLTHGIYRYPARFSPLFAHAAIEAFTKPGDFVLDPFVGGGTTLVEARILGRPSIGLDINPLAVFVTRAKTRVLSANDLAEIQAWARNLRDRLNLRKPPVRQPEWIDNGYQRNVSGRRTWHIRKTLELALSEVSCLPRQRQRDIARCALLAAGQWALDCRRSVPSARDFRDRIVAGLAETSEAVRQYSKSVSEAEKSLGGCAPCPAVCLHRSAIGLERDRRVVKLPPPRLILTSPPYPGVHVLYHRWQVLGRRETPAPFWIVGRADGQGPSFYTFGDRRQAGLVSYFEDMRRVFKSLATVAGPETVLVQLIGFSDPNWQLPQYLGALRDAGFVEMQPPRAIDSCDGRLWRNVPNRRWYADWHGATPASRELVLFHRLSTV